MPKGKSRVSTKRKSSTKKSTKISTISRRVSVLWKAVETKYYNQYPAGGYATSTAPISFEVFRLAGTPVPALGTDPNDRVGKTISVKSLNMRFQIYNPVATDFKSGTNPNYLRGVATGGTFANGAGTLGAVVDAAQMRYTMRMIIITTKGSAVTSTALLTAGSSSFIDTIAGSQFPTYCYNRYAWDHKTVKPIYDKTWSTSINDYHGGNYTKSIKLNFPKGHIVQYDDTNSLIDDGNMQILLYVDVAAAANAPTVYPNIEIKYIDL